MKRSEFRYLERLRVRWAEVDLQKIVFNGHYLMYFDTAVAGYWRALALPYHATMDALGGDLYVRKATLEYLASARYDEQLAVGMRCARIGRSSMVFAAAVFRGEHCLVHGELVYVFADPATQSPRAVPAPLRAVLESYEAGAAVCELLIGDWAHHGAAVLQVRQQVFVEELGLSPDIVNDGADSQALHVVALNRLGVPVASGRLLQRALGVAQVGRLACLPGLRGAQLGRALLQCLLQAARERGDGVVMLQAETSAVPFYERFGFQSTGEVFESAGVAHQTMQRTP